MFNYCDYDNYLFIYKLLFTSTYIGPLEFKFQIELTAFNFIITVKTKIDVF